MWLWHGCPPVRAGEVWTKLAPAFRAGLSPADWVAPLYCRLAMGSTHAAHVVTLIILNTVGLALTSSARLGSFGTHASDAVGTGLAVAFAGFGAADAYLVSRLCRAAKTEGVSATSQHITPPTTMSLSVDCYFAYQQWLARRLRSPYVLGLPWEPGCRTARRPLRRWASAFFVTGRRPRSCGHPLSRGW